MQRVYCGVVCLFGFGLGCGDNQTLVDSGGSDAEPVELNIRPAFVVGPAVIPSKLYDGVSDDLLTAGLGTVGLQGATPGYVDANNPTAAELRRNSIWAAYRSIDTTTNGGFGVLYGPNVSRDGTVSGDGKIAGEEFLAYDDDGTNKQNATMMVQIPSQFNPQKPCLIVAPSSGERTVYASVATAGNFGLQNGCAVVYTDKAGGNGVHDLSSDTVNIMDGTRMTATAAGTNANFNAGLTADELTAFVAQYPNRIALKSAHSQQNDQKNGGMFVLHAAEFGFYILNEKFSALAPDGVHKRRTIKPSNTLTIAISVSAGGGPVLAAIEQDSKDPTTALIDGAVASTPAVYTAPPAGLSIVRGATPVSSFGKPLPDFRSLQFLFGPCAALAPSLATAPAIATLDRTRATNRCTGLKEKGLLTATTTDAQADQALAILRAYGWEPEMDVLHASHFVQHTARVIMKTMSVGRLGVKDNLCGYSFGFVGTTGLPSAPGARLPTIFVTSNGAPPGGPVTIINNLSVGGAIRDTDSISPSTTRQDFNLDGALCLRGIATGIDPTTASALQGQALDTSTKVKTGLAETSRTGAAQGKPVILLHGRADAHELPSHNSRAYYGANMVKEGASSNVRYYELLNVTHFDQFNGSIAGYDTRYVPAHYYLLKSLSAMFDHLTLATALPPSQVVRTVARGGTPGAAPALTITNVPPISTSAPAGDLITFSNNTLTIPD